MREDPSLSRFCRTSRHVGPETIAIVNGYLVKLYPDLSFVDLLFLNAYLPSLFQSLLYPAPRYVNQRLNDRFLVAISKARRTSM